MQKTMQKLLARNISDESVGISTISIQICLQTREKHRKHNVSCDYIYTGRNQGSYIWALIDIEGSSDTNSHKKCCQMACAWRLILMMNWLQTGRQKNYRHTHRRKSGGICGQVLSTEGHFISTVELLGCRSSYRGSQEWLLYTVVCTILISRKFPNTVSQLLQGALSMKHAQFTAVLIFLYSVLFYEHINPLEHTVVSDATGLAIRFNTQSSARRLRHRCRLIVILAFCQ